ncbi:MAG: VWA domain-containing protein [Syntrophomonadaceae bacterium]|nr:VWA domain-containing protein [Syntrophomonadaceae bacterium]
MANNRNIEERRDAHDTAKSVGNYLKIYFEKGEGVRLGESCVASLRVHELGKLKGHVKVFSNQDAGQVILDYIDPGKIVNLNVFHKPGVIDPRLVAQRIWAAVEDYMTIEIPRLTDADDEKHECLVNYTIKIHVSTCVGKGLVLDLVEGQEIEPIELEERGRNYVQVMCKLTSDKYGIILPIVEAVEDTISESGLELGKVKRITNTTAQVKEQAEEGKGLSIPIPWKKFKNANYQLMKENQNQLMMKLAEKFGSIDDLEDFVDTLSTKLFKRTSQYDKKRKWGDLDEKTEHFKEMGLVKDTLLGPVLTQDGKDMKEYLLKHKCELEAEMRRKIRRTPGQAAWVSKLGNVSQQVSKLEFTNRNKTMRLNSRSWTGDLAVPETVVQAIKSSLLRNDSRLIIDKGNLTIYRKRSYVPIDICLLIDASGSMVGEKMEAACYLAEHLLLSGKDKVAVVTFQEMRANVVVPFTRRQRDLIRGLNRIVPGGMTPMADGIVTAVDIISSSRVKNPTMVLITDGIPNYPLWSFDSHKDALDAAAMIPDNKIKLICIGVEGNRSFLEKLTDKASGKLFVVDDLNRNNLTNIVKHEKKLMGLSAGK